MSTLLLVLLDPGLRRWLLHPAPYLAVLIAALIFSPVIVWNSLNDWASFSFQGTRRLQKPMQFSLHLLMGSILVLLTPVGLAAAAGSVFAWGNRGFGWLADRRTTFIAIYTLVPLSVFVGFSLFNDVKLNWTGPIWLALLPVLARTLTAKERTSELTVGLQRSWLATVAIMLLIYGAILHSLVLGLPGVGFGTDLSLKSLPIGWKEFGAQVEKIETDLENVTGREPLRVGMDRYFLSSESAFYDPDKDAVPHTAGRSLFGKDSLMYDRWFSPAAAEGRDIVLISRSSNGLIAAKTLAERFQELGPVREHVVRKDGHPIGKFYYRFGYNYVPYVIPAHVRNTSRTLNGRPAESRRPPSWRFPTSL